MCIYRRFAARWMPELGGWLEFGDAVQRLVGVPTCLSQAKHATEKVRDLDGGNDALTLHLTGAWWLLDPPRRRRPSPTT